MITERITLDTNILVYCFDRSAGVRRVLALRVIELARDGNCLLTLQSVSEFYAAVTRKRYLTVGQAALRAENWLAMFPCMPGSSTAIQTALTLAAAGRASYWDALLIATAAEGGCTAILTEDLADGSVLAGVKVVNPFGADELTSAALALLSA